MRRSKLVRDRVPEIARARGQAIWVERLGDEAYWLALIAKLREETEEFAERPSLKELADIAEVIRTLARLLGGTGTLEAVRQAKAAERGGFDRRVLMSWEDNGE